MNGSYFHLIFTGATTFKSFEMMSRICFMIKSEITRRMGSWENPSENKAVTTFIMGHV